MRSRGWAGETPSSDEEAIARILSAVDEEVAEHGAAIRVADVARRLGVTRQTVYRYFPNADALLIASAMRAADGFIDQVFEHVADLSQLAGEVARTTKPGGMGLHVFPGKWTFTERHLQAPLVHWLPKGRLRRVAIKTALRSGCAAPYFSERPLAERAQIFCEYSEGETFYRRPAVILRVLTSAGLVVDFDDMARQRVLSVLGDRRLPSPAVGLAAWLYRNTRMMYAATVKHA